MAVRFLRMLFAGYGVCNAVDGDCVWKGIVKGKVKLLFYFSFRSPFAGIALYRMRRAAEFKNVDIELMPVWPAILFGGHMDNPTDNLFKLSYVMQDAARQAEIVGLDTGYLNKVAKMLTIPESADYRSKKVGLPTSHEPWEVTHGAFLYAQSRGKGWAFADAIFNHRFGFDGAPTRDVLKSDIVAAIAKSVGLDGQSAAAAHQSSGIQSEIEAITRAGERDGVFGVPFFVLTGEAGKEIFWGNDRLEYVLRSLTGGTQLPSIAVPDLESILYE